MLKTFADVMICLVTEWHYTDFQWKLCVIHRWLIEYSKWRVRALSSFHPSAFVLNQKPCLYNATTKS